MFDISEKPAEEEKWFYLECLFLSVLDRKDTWLDLVYLGPAIVKKLSLEGTLLNIILLLTLITKKESAFSALFFPLDFCEIMG